MTNNSFTGQNFFTRFIMPLFLVTVCPPFAMLAWHINVNLDGSFVALWQEITEKGFLTVINEVWFSRFFGTLIAWKIIGIFAALQLLLMRIIPGKKYTGTITPMGNLPEYKDNGLASYIITFGLFLGSSVWIKLFSPAIVYTHFGDILGALNFTALVFCLFLYLKGKYFPSSTDNGSTGNFLFDYYWGTELYPRILAWDVKQFTNCRFGMTGWAISVTSFAFAQQELYGSADWSIIISAALIVIYLFKFFIWEAGYMRSMDIIVDRAGFYICWGCLVWVPAIYTSPVMFMVKHPVELSGGFAALIFAAGAVAIFINYWADRQRQVVRATDGNTTIWGKPPVLIRATYTTETGQQKTNLLLASGFWGISSHFHYVPEILATFFWSCATGFSYFMPFFYVIFLTILLTHRAFRDDVKCRNKYGAYWDEYRKKVPYKIIPGIV
jgi:7-dehydrocholesterol reductase